MKKTRPALAAPLFALALLAACSGSEPEQSAVTNEGEMLDVTDEAANVVEAPLVMNTPAPVVENAVEEAPVQDEAQVEDDAAATGLTARVDREAEATATANDTVPVSERK